MAGSLYRTNRRVNPGPSGARSDNAQYGYQPADIGSNGAGNRPSYPTSPGPGRLIDAYNKSKGPSTTGTVGQ